MELLKSENEGYGFYGTMSLDGCADAAWKLAMTAVARATQAEPEYVRAFLDSHWGRHFADTVHDFLGRLSLEQAIAAAVTRWNGWKLGARTRKELDIPLPMSYLSGMVYAAASYADVI